MFNAGTLNSYAQGLINLVLHPRIKHLAGSPQQGDQAWPQLFEADARMLLESEELLHEEVFGPVTLVIRVTDQAQLQAALGGLQGQLTATLIGEPEDFEALPELTGLIGVKGGAHPAQRLPYGCRSL